MGPDFVIRLARPSIPDEAVAEVGRILRAGDLVQGVVVNHFEEVLADRLAVPEAVAVSSGTAALHVALLAAGVGPGDEVVIPAFTFPAAGNAVVRTGATPVAVDISLTDYCLDPTRLEAALSSRTRVVVPVHEFGISSDWSTISRVAAKRDVDVIEDAACAIGANYRDRPVGSLGRFGCFSFHPRKTITTGEGGLVTASNDEDAQALRELRNHGMVQGPHGWDFVRAGLNYRMTEFQAALGLGQLPMLEDLIGGRRRQAEQYHSQLAGLPLTLPRDLPERRHTWQTYHVLVDASFSRDAVIAGMKKLGVEVNLGAQALPAMTFFVESQGWREDAFPAASAAYRRGLALPIGSHLTDEAQASVVDALRTVLSSLTRTPE